MISIRSLQIKLCSIEDIKNFVKTVSKYPVDTTLKSGRYTVCAKSLMGIFSLDLLKPLELIIDGDNHEPLLSEVAQYAV